MKSLQTQILDRVRRSGRGKVFIPKDFLDIGTREAVDQALGRLVKAGDIQRLGRGLYHYPRMNARLGIALAPDTDEIAEALARQTGTRIAPSGATAANRLGLSTQVPAKPVYLTDGRSRQVRVGELVFLVKHAAPKDLPLGSQTSATVFQALRYLGKEAVTPDVISRIRRSLTPQQRTKLRQDARYTTDWIADTVQLITKAAAKEAVHG